jgi:hypothetical protein
LTQRRVLRIIAGDEKKERSMTEPPDTDLEYDWGGDGSDLNVPVRAHVEAALVPTAAPYPPPLDQLLQLGEIYEDPDGDARVAALGLTQEHVPDLVRMARDRALNTAPSDSDEVWAPIHALRALENLDISAVVGDLIPLFDVDSEWFGEGLIDVLGKAGPSALEPLGRYVQDRTRWISGRNYALETLGNLAERNPELRDRAVQVLRDTLDHAADNDPGTNGFVIGELIDLDAVEALPSIRHAFEQDRVDETVAGDWGEVLAELGQEPDPADDLVERSRQRREERRAAMFGGARLMPPSAAAPTAPKKSKANKQKAQRKQSKASRKANKRKKKRK